MEVTIDGRKLALEGPVTVLEAARRLGIEIPTLCWHPRVSVLGACRLCMIEVEGINRLLAACTTQVSDGMSVLTDTPQLRKVRETMLELLLCRHPLDCPTCVKGGECELQDLAYRFSSPRSRFAENPPPYPVSDPSPFVERDPKKCVLCRRCIRVCREVRGRTVLGAMERGCHKRVGTYFQRPLDSDFQEPYNCEACGSCINICPVGALNSKARKFRARTWEGERRDTVCPFCSVGCALTIQVKEGELVRAVPRPGPNNQDQACFRGRFGTDYVNATEGLIAPLLRRDGRLVPAERAESVSFAAGRIRGAKRTAALISSSLTREEAAAAASFVRQFSPGAEVAAVDTLGIEESSRLVSLAGRSWEDIEAADLVVVAGQDFSVFHPVAGVRIRVARAATGAGLVVLDPRDTLLGSEADLWLRPAGAGLPLLLGAVLHGLAATRGERLKAPVDETFLAACPGRDAAAAEKTLRLAGGAVEDLVRRLAAGEKVVFVAHRGWHDGEDLAAVIMGELDRLLAGKEAGGIVFLGRDCNSRWTASLNLPLAAAAVPADLLLVFGADPAGTALPDSRVAGMLREAGDVIVFDSLPTKTARAAAAVFPLPHFAEKEGTFEACNGLVQPLGRAMSPSPGVLPLARTLGEIAESMGREFSEPGTGPEEVRDEEASAGDVLLPEGRAFPSLPAEGERYIVFRALRVADRRLRVVRESEMLFPGRVLEVHPGDAAPLGVEAGSEVELVSGGGSLRLRVKADLRVPRGQVHVPLDMEDEELAAFAARSERPPGWPPTFRRLDSLAGAAGTSGEEGS